MSRTKLGIPVLLLALIFVLATALPAQDKDTDKAFKGSLSFGYRAVDQGGSMDMYRQHINLDKGFRLFNVSLSYTPTGTLKGVFDRIEFNAYNLGGDPFEILGLSIQKYGTYKFQYDHRKSTYFYGDMNESRAGRLFDPAQFNFDRVSDSGLFNLTLNRNLNVFVNFDHYTKSGSSVTTFDADTAILEGSRPVSERMTELAVGADLHSARYGLVFEQRHQDYKNTNSFFLAGPFDFKTDASTVRLNLRPFDNLILRGSAQLNKQNSNVTTLEEPGLLETANGRGSFTRKIELYDADLTYLLLRKLAVVGGVRYNTFSQTGHVTVDGEFQAVDIGYNTLGVDAGLQYQASAKFSLTFGYRYEKRKLTGAGEEVQMESSESETTETGLQSISHTDSTVRKGVFGNLKWNFAAFKLTFDYQHGDYDDPFTLISPTQFDRFRATLRYQMKAFNLTASYLTARTENLVPGGVIFRVIYTENTWDDLWKSSNDQFNLRLGYTGAKFNFSLGYSYIAFKADSERLIEYVPYWSGPAGEFPWSIHYQGKSTILDASFGYTLDENWKFGAYLNSYNNTGFWPLERLLVKGYVEYTFQGGFVSQIAYRYTNFKQTDSVIIIKNNYSAGILEISFGYRWQ